MQLFKRSRNQKAVFGQSEEDSNRLYQWLDEIGSMEFACRLHLHSLSIADLIPLYREKADKIGEDIRMLEADKQEHQELLGKCKLSPYSEDLISGRISNEIDEIGGKLLALRREKEKYERSLGEITSIVNEECAGCDLISSKLEA
ncbi:MAG: hypothetical protein QXW10_03930, partial [Candidatus Micrarchaeaceae archaeon]